MGYPCTVSKIKQEKKIKKQTYKLVKLKTQAKKKQKQMNIPSMVCNKCRLN